MEVISGVPQITIFDPVLSFLVIDIIENNTYSAISLLAGGCLMNKSFQKTVEYGRRVRSGHYRLLVQVVVDVF